jgi:phospholipid/cholesterol/gamma-HCH transport system ATP-binding protein
VTGPRDDEPVGLGERRGAERRGSRDAQVRAVIRDELSTLGADARPRAEDPGPAPGAVIELERVHLAFDERVILEDVSFLAKKGETVVVVGESGTGKSTTLKLILRLLVPDAGCVYVGGRDIAKLTFEEALKVRQRMGMVFQSAALFDSMSVYENVAYPLREHTDYDDDEIERRVREKLQFVDLNPDEILELLPSALSGGMRKRAAIARSLALEPPLLMLDEPSSGLDPITSAEIDQLIRTLAHGLGLTVIVVTHELGSIDAIVDSCILLDRDTRSILARGAPRELQASTIPRVQHFFRRQPEHG